MTRDEMIEAFSGVIVYVLDPHGTDDGEHVARQAIHALDALRAPPRVPEGYVLCKAEPVAWMTVDTRYDHIHTFFTKEQAQSVAICCHGTVRPLYEPAEQAGGADESPTKYYGGPRGGSMSQNAPLAAPTEAEVEAPPMTERYVKVSELGRLARKWLERKDRRDSEGLYTNVATATLEECRRELNEVMGSNAETREVAEDAEREAFEMWAATHPLARFVFYPKDVMFSDAEPYPLDRTVPWLKQAGDGGYWNEKVNDAWMVWKAAKRHERGEG